MRFTKNPNQEKYLEKGELRPELASILCLISEPQDDDIFMDPFCGSGSISIQRLFIPNIKYGEIIAADNDPKFINKLKGKIKKLQRKKTVRKFIIKKFDALNLKSLPDNLVNKIVTDPPWGLYFDKIDNIEEFYKSMLNEFFRVLARKGILVIIIAKKELFEGVLKKFLNKFKLLKRYDTLVSGQKAAVYKVRVIK